MEIREVSEMMIGSCVGLVDNEAGGQDVGGREIGREIGRERMVRDGAVETSASSELILGMSFAVKSRSVSDRAIASSNSFRRSKLWRRSMAPCIRSSVSKLITPRVK
jgi:hypothetical protein